MLNSKFYCLFALMYQQCNHTKIPVGQSNGKTKIYQSPIRQEWN